jgi:general secretion pathway protein C
MELPKSLTRIPSVAEFGGSKSLAGSAPLVVSAGLAVLLAWQLVQLGWTLLGANPAPMPESVVDEPVPGGTAGGAALDVQAIVNAHLFGVAGATTPAETDPNAVATTRMNLLLLGTIARPDPSLGYAIIGESASSAKVYKLEALLLPKTFKGSPAPAPAASAALRASPNLAQQIQAMAQGNPGAITQIMRPQPVFANGQQRGYRVYPGRDRQQFARLGLMPGDLVTEINGTPLDDPSRGMEILQSINSASEVTVTVERNGQPTQININTAAVAAEAAAAAAQPEGIPVTEVPVESSPEEMNQ